MTANAKLSNLTKMWKKVTPIASGFSQVPDGSYVGDLKEMIIEEAKKSGRLQVTSTYEIVDGEFLGKTVKTFDGLDNETSAGYFKNTCEVIGLDLPEDAELWQETMDAFVGNPERLDLYDITIKSSTGKDGKTYSNTYVNGISEYTKGAEEGAEEEVVEEAVEELVEEIVEEEVQQEVKAPLMKRFATRPVANAKPVAQVATKVAAKPVVTRKIVAKR